MRDRLLALLCGILIGLLLRSVFVGEPPAAGAPAAAPGSAQSQTRADPRCADHPVKMPCLFDTASPGK